MSIATADLVTSAEVLVERVRGTEHEAAAQQVLEQAIAAQRSVLNVLAVVGIAAVHLGLDVDLRESAVGERADKVVATVRAA
jgi:hypothetical protein